VSLQIRFRKNTNALFQQRLRPYLCAWHAKSVELWSSSRSCHDRLQVKWCDDHDNDRYSCKNINGTYYYDGLSPRERDVAETSIGSGLSKAQLACSLFISEETVKSQLREAYRKIGVGSRMELLSAVLGVDGKRPTCSHAHGNAASSPSD